MLLDFGSWELSFLFPSGLQHTSLKLRVLAFPAVVSLRTAPGGGWFSFSLPRRTVPQSGQVFTSGVAALTELYSVNSYSVSAFLVFLRG